jgi:hypothetical protein
MKQTAVEWYNEEINKLNVGNDARVFIAKLFEKANKMFEEQINNAHYEGSENYRRQYYNETFKSK